MEKRVIIVLAVITLASTASAFGCDFLENKTMKLSHGEVGIFCIYLQNIGDKEVVQRITISSGSQFIQNLDEISKEYSVPTNTVSDKLPVCMKLKLPEGAKEGEKFTVVFSVGSVNNQRGGMAQVSSRISDRIYLTLNPLPQELREDPPSPQESHIIAVLFILSLLFVAFGYLASKKKPWRNNS